MERVLIVSTAANGRTMLSELLSDRSRFSLTLTESGASARRMLTDLTFDLVIINAPLKDEFGHELAQRAAEVTTAGVMLMVKQEMVEEIADRVEEYGVFAVEKPISRAVFYNTLRMVFAARKRLTMLKNENERLQGKIQEMRLVDRAKCVLIQYLKLSEPQAHRYIEKQAMDLRVSRKKIAEQILNTYEN